MLRVDDTLYDDVVPEAALCSRCGAPAKAEERSCGFCGTAFAHAPSAQPEERVDTKLQNFLGALSVEGVDLSSALRRSIPAVLGRNPDAERIARGVVALVEVFQREESVKLDATSAGRLFAAYLKARVELRSTEETELNLPFLIADASGPKHFHKTLRRADLQRLESSPK